MKKDVSEKKTLKFLHYNTNYFNWLRNYVKVEIQNYANAGLIFPIHIKKLNNTWNLANTVLDAVFSNPQIPQVSRSHLKILHPRMMTWNKFHNKDP
jgi:hypothetical protein